MRMETPIPINQSIRLSLEFIVSSLAFTASILLSKRRIRLAEAISSSICLNRCASRPDMPTLVSMSYIATLSSASSGLTGVADTGSFPVSLSAMVIDTAPWGWFQLRICLREKDPFYPRVLDLGAACIWPSNIRQGAYDSKPAYLCLVHFPAVWHGYVHNSPLDACPHTENLNWLRNSNIDSTSFVLNPSTCRSNPSSIFAVQISTPVQADWKDLQDMIIK